MGTVEKINQWGTLASSLIPLLFMMQFLGELKILKKTCVNNSAQKSSENLLIFAGIIAFIFTVTFGALIIKDSYWKSYWDTWNEERAQELVNRSEVRTFVSSKGDKLEYLLMKPLDYDPQQNYPLVVCLPYGGYHAPAAQLLSVDINRKKYPAFLFVPHCQQGLGWGGIARFPARDSLVYDALNALDDRGIDEKRRYVSGVSLGGYGSWHFISTHPEMFAAAIPVCGEGDPQQASKVVDVPVWAFHGEKDRNVPVSGSRDMIQAIKNAGGNPKYTEFAGEGHNIWDKVTKTPGLLDWLFAQKRD
jgi:predicted peptidase